VYAARMGVTLERLLLIRPETPLEALDLTRDVLGTQPVGALVLDVGPTLPKREALRRLTAALPRHGPALLLLGWLSRVTDRSYLAQLPAHLRLLVRRLEWIWEGREVVGVQVAMERLGTGSDGGSVTCAVYFDGREGVS
jgi:hypothetical protein